METFKALVAERHDDRVDRRTDSLTLEDLPQGEVTVRVAWSSVNYKDALAVSPKGRVARISPLVPGIDLAGEVTASDAPEFRPGDRVLAHGYDLGVSHFGGFAEYARVPAGWVVPLPAGLSLRQAMALGTAGYTAGLSVQSLEERGLHPGAGPVLVLGASGGVGSTAVGILAGRGYEVWASTGKREEEAFLRGLGASEVLPREETSAEGSRPLEPARWAGCVDPVGGASLAYALRTLREGAAVAASGNTGGVELHTTVLPFILRGVALLGVDSAHTPIERRRRVWERLAGDLRPRGLDEWITREVSLDDLGGVLDDTLAGRGRGRTVVRVGGG
ncbi:MAG TPA: oxidoreductase [Actinomycetota bacterium]|nr:oxidoreductase [Actinomycetota bacterium]